MRIQLRMLIATIAFIASATAAAADAATTLAPSGPAQSGQTAVSPVRASDTTQTTDRTLEYAQGPGPYAFDCDAPWGKAKELKIRAPGDKLRITGSIRFLYTGGVPREWLPAATVALVQEDKQISVGLEAIVSGDINNIELAHGLSRYQIAPLVNNGEAIPFGLTLDQSGKATASLWGSTSPASFQILSDIDHVTLSCATTHVRFTDITIVALK
jgi:hypothetical protein